MKLLHTSRAGTLACLLAVSTVASGQALINASKTASGTFTPVIWQSVVFAPNANVSGALTFRELGQGKIGSETNTYYALAPWFHAYAASPLFPKVERLKPLSGYVDLGQEYAYTSSVSERALVDMIASPRKTSSFTHASGSATTTLSYAIKIQHTSATPVSYFASIRNPKRTFSFDAAYSLCCSGDSNGGTYSYIKPKAARSRSTVDLMADGLPIYSSEETYLFPASQANFATDKLESRWGDVRLDGDTSVVFLGKLSAGQTVNLNLVVHTDVVTDAKTCGYEGGGFYNPVITVHCTKVQESLQLGNPGDTQSVPAVQIFGKTGL